MKFSLLKYKVEPGKAYMLRNDGKLIECDKYIQNMHPYFLVKGSIANVNEALDFFNEDEGIQNCWMWFEKYMNKDTKPLFNKVIIELINYAYKNNLEYIASELKDIFHLKENNTISIENINNDLFKLNDELNKQFCRVRIGDKFQAINSGDAYFRICPGGINWFNYIWQICYDNKNRLDTITICKDKASCGTDEIYSLHGTVVNKLDINDFIELSGNPVVENLSIV